MDTREDLYPFPNPSNLQPTASLKTERLQHYLRMLSILYNLSMLPVFVATFMSACWSVFLTSSRIFDSSPTIDSSILGGGIFHLSSSSVHTFSQSDYEGLLPIPTRRYCNTTIRSYKEGPLYYVEYKNCYA